MILESLVGLSLIVNVSVESAIQPALGNATNGLSTPQKSSVMQPLVRTATECILRAVAADPLVKLDTDVAYFLGKKAHILARADGQGHDISDKGRDSLADIDTLGL